MPVAVYQRGKVGPALAYEYARVGKREGIRLTGTVRRVFWISPIAFRQSLFYNLKN